MTLRFLTEPPDASLLIYGVYQPWLVMLSVLVAIFASIVALETARQLEKTASGRVRTILLIVGSLALGGGVWSMHFVGMLAFQLCGGADYDPLMTLFSMLPSVLASAVALSLLSEKNVTPSRMLAGGVLIGLGIGTMHYTGMAAMRVAATLAYDPVLFVLSVLVAVVLSVLALWIRFGLMRYWPSLSPTLALLAGGTVQGLAIAGMHYTGMAAAVFTGDPTRCSFIEGLSDSSFLAIAIGGVTMLITLLAMGFNIFMRQTDLVTRLRQQRQSQAAIVQTSVEGIILLSFP